MTIEGIAFDLEGTVVDVEAAHHLAHLSVAVLAGLNFDLDTAIDKLPHFIGGPDEKIMAEIYNLGDKRLSTDELLLYDTRFYEQNLTTMEIVPRDGFLDFYHYCQTQGLKASLGSLTSQNQARTLLDRSGLSALFNSQHIILREHVANLKPAPDVFLRTAQVMGISPKSQLVFEDSPRGVQAAIAAGSVAIGIPVYDKPQTWNSLESAGAYRIYHSWREIDLSELLSSLVGK